MQDKEKTARKAVAFRGFLTQYCGAEASIKIQDFFGGAISKQDARQDRYRDLFRGSLNFREVFSRNTLPDFAKRSYNTVHELSVQKLHASFIMAISVA